MSKFTAAYFRPSPAPLHLNEMPHDIPPELRRRILDQLERVAFNRYPETPPTSLLHKLASWYGCAPTQLMVGPGSSAFIRLLLTRFGPQVRGRLVITRPSFAYYEEFCQAFNIPYDTWELDRNFQYDITTLKDLPEYSVVCLTTPNNPTGNVLSAAALAMLLQRHPSSLFVVDEAYGEFASETMLPLLNDHDNVILLRTFSKAMGVAGIRCGVLMGEPTLVASLGRLQTPWELSSLIIESSKVVIDYARETTWIQSRVQEVTDQRQRLLHVCRSVLGPEHFILHPSSANFLLVEAKTSDRHLRLITACAQLGLQVRDLHHQPRLARCVRVTIGNPAQNDLFVTAFQRANQSD